MGEIQIGFLQKDSMSLFITILLTRSLEKQQKITKSPFSLDVKKTLKEQIPLKQLDGREIDYFYTITTLDSIKEWKSELLKGIHERCWVLITPENAELQNYNELTQDINYNKNTMIQLLNKDNLALGDTSYFTGFISHLIYPERATALDYMVSDRLMQTEQLRDKLETIHKYCEKQDHRFGEKRIADKTISEKMHDKKQEQTFPVVSYIFRNSVRNLFDDPMVSYVVTFLNLVEPILSREIESWAKEYYSKTTT